MVVAMGCGYGYSACEKIAKVTCNLGLPKYTNPGRANCLAPFVCLEAEHDRFL